MAAVWAGIDSGKRAHHCVVMDAGGRVLLSRRVVNDESALVELIAACWPWPAGTGCCGLPI
jgi:Transposase